MLIYDKYTEEGSQAEGERDVNANPRAYSHQVYVEAAAGATGTVAVSYLPNHSTVYVPLLDESDAQVVFDLADPGQPALFCGSLLSIRFTPSGVNGNYRGLACGWVD